MYELFDAIIGLGTELNKLLGPDIRKIRLKRALINSGKSSEQAQAYVTILEAFTPLIKINVDIPTDTWMKIAPVFSEVLNNNELAHIWFVDDQTISRVNNYLYQFYRRA